MSPYLGKLSDREIPLGKGYVEWNRSRKAPSSLDQCSGFVYTFGGMGFLMFM